MVTKRLIIQSGDAVVAKYLDLAQPFHEDYAARCGAEFWRFDGVWPGAPTPAWNRLPMCLDAYERGFEQVLWLDADTLVVRPEVNIFEEWQFDHDGWYRAARRELENCLLPSIAMRRTAGGFYWPMDGDDQWEGWNDGVLLIDLTHPNCAGAVADLWEKRNALPLPHHQPTLWELNWLLDYAKANPDAVAEMHQRFNWQPFNGASPEQYAVIKAWHGLPHQQRWDEMQACAEALVAGRSPVAAVRDTTPQILE
jgi:hypothetical protein